MSDELDDELIIDEPKKNKPRELELFVIRNTMKNESGRAMMWRFLQQTGIFHSSFSSDTHLHAFSAGKRAHGLWLEQELKEASEDYYYLMLRENR